MTGQKNETKILVNFDGADLLQQAFKGNDNLLKIIRALLFGYELTIDEKAQINSAFKGNELLQTEVRKKIFQEQNKDNPIGANPDFWVGTESEILGQHPDTVKQILESKNRCLDMLRKGVALLNNPDGPRVSIEYSPELALNDPSGVILIARNLYIKAVETGLSFCKIISEMDLEKAKQEAKDSSK